MAAPSGHDKMAAEAVSEYMQVVVDGDLQPGQEVVVLQGPDMRAADISPELLHSIVRSDTVFYLQADGSLVPGGTLAEVTGGEGSVGAAPVMMDAALQLKNVAEHVTSKQEAPSQVCRAPNEKQLKSICVQVPGLKPKESRELVNVMESASIPVNVSSNARSVVPTPVVQVKAAPQLSLVIKAEQPLVPILMQQRATPTAQSSDADPNEGVDSAEEHGCCVAHHQYGKCGLGSTKKGQKRKKPIKVKTRSGRVSRPPKHKAKDYKFLKVGDSIQDSSVDSDDFSEMSSEEEVDGGIERVPPDRQTCAVKNSLFQCQKCEKSYMGKGGLFRHYRLYPTHGQMDPSFVLEAKKGGDGGGTGEHKKPTPRPRKRLLEDPAHPNLPNQQTLAKDGLEILTITTPCRGRRQITGRRFGRPRKLLRNGVVGEHVLTVKELIQQCEVKDLKEQVAPSFTKLLSVYDFLLLKVKQEHVDNKPLFPHVYKEFEKLHSMVKDLAEEYVINMDQNVEKPLEVTDCKIAESLGISKEMTVKAASPPSVNVEQEAQIEENEDESSDEESMPPSKRSKLENKNHKSVAQNQSARVGETTQSGDVEQLDNYELNSAADSETSTEVAAKNDLLLDVAECHADTQIKADLQESCSPQSQDHPLNLSCQIAEEILSLQTRMVQNGTLETAEAEPSADLPQACDIEPEAIPEITCDSNLASVECSQEVEHSRTVISPSNPMTLAEAVCGEASQVSYVEVGGTLIPTTNTFTAGSLNVSGVTPAFSLTHGQELVFIHSTEESAAEETVVIFDNTGAAESPLDAVVALVEMQSDL